MRWDDLFRDLEGQLAAQETAEFDAELADRTRRAAASIALDARLLDACGAAVTVFLDGGNALRGELLDAAPQWLLLGEGGERTALIPVAAVLGVSGLGRFAGAPRRDATVSRRLGLGVALRGLARDRSAVQLLLRDGSTCSGVLDRVGADHVDLAERRDTPVGVRAVPFAALSAVRRG